MGNMEKRIDDQPAAKQHDEKVFRDGNAIFSEDDLRKLINDVYTEYQYKGSQFEKLSRMINFLALDNNKFIQSELAGQSDKLHDYLVSFLEFLKRNFHQGPKGEDGDTIYLLSIQETGYQTESFLIEFQTISMDIENAYKNYRKAAKNQLQI
jgi:hypothetical protein